MIYDNLKEIQNDIVISRKPASGLNNKIKPKKFKQKLKKIINNKNYNSYYKLAKKLECSPQTVKKIYGRNGI